jgi:hypothetical protein
MSVIKKTYYQEREDTSSNLFSSIITLLQQQKNELCTVSIVFYPVRQDEIEIVQVQKNTS